MSSEHRQAPRVRSFLRGEILHSNGASRTECIIRDISDVGARIQLSSVITVPDTFDLVIPQRSTSLRARIVWRHGEELGVTFANRDAATTRPAGEDANARIAALEAEVHRLRVQMNKLANRMAEITGD